MKLLMKTRRATGEVVLYDAERTTPQKIAGPHATETTEGWLSSDTEWLASHATFGLVNVLDPEDAPYVASEDPAHPEYKG